MSLHELTVDELYFDLDLPAGDAVWLRAIEELPPLTEVPSE